MLNSITYLTQIEFLQIIERFLARVSHCGQEALVEETEARHRHQQTEREVLKVGQQEAEHAPVSEQ
jgi:hypothetical protein